MTKVAVVDRFPVVREGVIAVLSSEPEVSVVAEGDTLSDVLGQAGSTSPDVVVLGVRLSEPDDIEDARSLLERFPDLRVLVVSSLSNAALLRAASAIGAHGFVIKESERSVFREAVKTLGSGQCFVDPAASALSRSRARHTKSTAASSHGLSPRQSLVLDLVAQGLSSRGIAEKLGVSTETVKAHMARAKAKLGARSRTEAVALAAGEQRAVSARSA